MTLVKFGRSASSIVPSGLANEAFMAGYVNNPESEAAAVEMRESQVDRNPARLFLGQSVGVDARQFQDERRLAVINVAGRSNQHGLRSC